MRALAPLALLGLLLLAPRAGGQEEGSSTTERTESLERDVDRELVDPPPSEHLGWGTLEDVFVQLGGGAAVSTLSGNLVVHVEPVARPWLPAGVRMALTYNHRSGDGAVDLGAGWSFDLGRFTVQGPWGDRMLVDSDGFRDTFWAGPPPTGEELGRATDAVIAAWRRDTPAGQRRRLGGVRALRELLVSDPATLGAMRLRYLGPPPIDDEAPTLFRSGARGVRTIEPDGEGVVLTDGDGGRHVFGRTGMLERMEPASGPAWQLQYEEGRVRSVVSRGIEEWALERDSRGRIASFRDPGGDGARIEYLGALLRTIDAPRGGWEFGYDERARLVSIEGPEGRVDVRYGLDGRVQAASGPLAKAELSESADTEAVSVAVTGLPGGVQTVTWEPGLRRRSVRGATSTEAVTFARSAALPVRVQTDGSDVALTWSEGGRLLGVARGRTAVSVERDALGAVTGVRAGGERGAVSSKEGRILTWTDPATRRTALERDEEGRLRAVRRPGGAELGVRWHQRGGLSEVAQRDGVRVGMPREGIPVAPLVWGGATAGVRRDPSGHLTAFEGPTGLSVRLMLELEGRIASIRDDRAVVTLTYEGTGLLRGWSGPDGAVALRRDPTGRPVALSEGADTRWELVRGPDGRAVRLDEDGHRRAVEFDADGLRSVERPGGGRATFDRRDGHVVRIDDTSLGTLELERDDSERTVGVRRGVGAWRILRDRTGRPQGLSDPLGARADFTLDDAGRVASVLAAEGQGWRLRRDPAGRIETVRSPEGDWIARRGGDGLLQELRTPSGASALLRHDPRGRPVELMLPRGASTRLRWGLSAPSQLGAIRWRIGSAGGLVGWGDQDEAELRWFVDTDERGRARALKLRKGPTLELARQGPRPSRVGPWALTWGPSGLQRLTQGGGDAAPEWTIGRDSAGRAQRFTDHRGRMVRVGRDLAGDVRTVELEDDGTKHGAVVQRNQAARIDTVALDSLDSTLRIGRDGLGRLRRVARERSGAAVAVVDVTWSDVPPPEAGLLAKAFGVETDDDPPPRQPAGSHTLTVSDGLGRVRLRHGTVLDIDSRGHAPLPLPGVVPEATPSWDSAARWGGAALPPPVTIGPHPGGDAERVLRLWTANAPRAEDLAWMPAAVPESIRAWAYADPSPREGLLPETAGRFGAGALLTPFPAATALVPGPLDTARVSLAELLVLAGDLPPELLLISTVGEASASAWQIDLPGAAALRAIRRRLADPTLPPGTGDRAIAAVAPRAFGVLTGRGARLEDARRWEVQPAITGLPAGTPALLPGQDGGLDGLADDPLGIGEVALGVAHARSRLLALQALVGTAHNALDGLLPDPAAAESWLIELPSGVRLVLDGRGRLLSIDAAGRLHDAHSRATAALMARALIADTVPARGDGSLSDPTDSSPWIPQFLPERGAVVESRWGLVPALPELPIDAGGRVRARGWPALEE